MSKVVAIAGKGGVGKTTFAALLIRYLIEERKISPVLALDLDPNSNLNELLGVCVNHTIGEARELLKKEVPPGMTKHMWFEYKIHQAIVEGKGFDLLVMGRPEGPGCYCAANSIAKESIETLKKNYKFIVVDNEAGMEHMSRLVTQNVDSLYILSDPTPRGLETAHRMIGLIDELNLNIKEFYIIVNRVKPERKEELYLLVEKKGININGIIREDEYLIKADTEEVSIFGLKGDTISLMDAYSIFEKNIE
ncbi:MAG TPA: AAA family ATPase [Syntrophorhabdaceae bacterium]|mgnify:CR=1 FL=1|nr:AAA family ATPase [Syntrophorhabdaceae bacterium]HPU30000.1 AAA family ATPase [Syntrophorhabdaceae bacterium]